MRKVSGLMAGLCLAALASAWSGVVSGAVNAQAADGSAALQQSRMQSPVLEMRQGKVIGERVGQVSSFKGIPFAAPPIGERRWRPPESAPGWPGERDARAFGPDCIQSPYPENSLFYRPARLSSEDCLYLNIWTAVGSDSDDAEKAPVMVWIHGGALTRGSGAISAYDGTRLADALGAV